LRSAAVRGNPVLGETCIFTFSGFRLDVKRGVLMHNEDVVAIRPKSFALLSYLARNANRVVSKDELISALWDRRAVTDDALAQTVKDLRIALGSEAGGLIKTLPKRGYIFLIDLSHAKGGHRDGDSLVSGCLTGDERPATPSVVVVRRPTIAVLPFPSVADKPAQQQFAAELVIDITTALSRIAWLDVISGGIEAYPDRPSNSCRMARELGVNYVLAGSMRRSESSLRTTVQLLAANTGVHLWAERFETPVDSGFVALDRICDLVVAGCEPILQSAEVRRSSSLARTDCGAFELYLRAVPFVASQMPADAKLALPYLEASLALDPNNAATHALMAWCNEWLFSRDGLQPENRSDALKHAHAAIIGATKDASALAIGGFVITMLEEDRTWGFEAIKRGLQLNAASSTPFYLASLAYAFAGEAAKASIFAKRAVRLNALQPLRYQAYLAMGLAAIRNDEYAEAACHLLRSISYNPSLSVLYFVGAAALALADREEAAEKLVMRGLAAEPSFRLRSVHELMAPSVADRIARGGHMIALPD
jgi:adenylate cyclase